MLTNLPFYIRFTIILLMLALIFGLLYFASGLLMPIGLAALLAILLNPLVTRMEKWRFPRVVAIFIAIILILVVISGLIYLLSTQLMIFVGDIPALKDTIGLKLASLQTFIQHKLGISPQKQIAWANTRISSTLQGSGSIITSTLTATAGTLATIGVLPIYIFFFIFYKDKFRNFLFRVNPDNRHYQIRTVIEQINAMVQSYLTGVFMVIGILAVLNTTGLMLLGIKYAIFLGVFAALLNIIPYIGILIGNLTAATVAFLTKDSIWYALGVILMFGFIQFIENNFLTPFITGSRVSLNPLGTIIALVAGGLLWGVVGMIVFIPFLGILKVVFDNMEEMKPYGYLLGTDEESEKEKKKRLAAQRLANWVRGKRNN